MDNSVHEIAMAKAVFNRVPVPFGLSGKPNLVAAWIDYAGESSGCSLATKSQELSNYIGSYLKTRGLNDATIAEAFGETENSFLMPAGLVPAVDAKRLVMKSGQVMMHSANPGQVAAMKNETKRQLRLKVWLRTGQMIGEVQVSQLLEQLQNGAEQWSTHQQNRIQTNSDMEMIRATRTTMVQRPGR